MSGDVMNFPDNWWKFVQQYQFADKEEIYTNGSMLIPSFRVRQMVEHYFGGKVGKTSCYAERTCKVESRCEFSYDFSPEIYYEFKMECGGQFDSINEEPPRYCPNCGSRVVE